MRDKLLESIEKDYVKERYCDWVAKYRIKRGSVPVKFPSILSHFSIFMDNEYPVTSTQLGRWLTRDFYKRNRGQMGIFYFFERDFTND